MPTKKKWKGRLMLRKILGKGLRALIGLERFGAVVYRLDPERARAWGGPMNGQGARCLMIAELITGLKPVAIVETGTYLGATTVWLSSFQLPVYTCEASPEYFGYARAHLAATPNVNILPLDSRRALEEILDGPLRDTREEPLLFYLDAHWNEDLPLAEEIAIIFSRAPNAVVVVDDFQVPDDPGYGFDDYGPAKVLNTTYIVSHLAELSLARFFPVTQSAYETGDCRGCVVLVQNPVVASALDRHTLIRRL